MFSYTKWLSLPLVTRQKIATIFNIPKLRATHVANDQILDDGYDVRDIEKVMSLSSLQEYTGNNSNDILMLYELMLDKVEGKPIIEVPQVEIKAEDIVPGAVIKITPEATPIPIEVITTKKKYVYKTKKNK
jgi:hypothetical protein